ncbi:MAG: hypothetical protein IPK82_23355 [Polyangiaceae bacterium]|nr:hypothetical protein [Polyangiaceae bacterium]
MSKSNLSLFEDDGERVAKECEYWPTLEGWPFRSLVDALDKPFRPGVRVECAAGEGHMVRHVDAVLGPGEWDLIEVRPDALAKAREVSTVRRAWASAAQSVLKRQGFEGVALFVTNPPNSLAAELFRLCVMAERSADVVFLVPLAFVTSKDRAEVVREIPIDVYPLGQRPTFNGAGSDRRDHAWVIAGPGRGGRIFPPLFPASNAPLQCWECGERFPGACGAGIGRAPCVKRRAHLEPCSPLCSACEAKRTPLAPRALPAPVTAWDFITRAHAAGKAGDEAAFAKLTNLLEREAWKEGNESREAPSVCPAAQIKRSAARTVGMTKPAFAQAAEAWLQWSRWFRWIRLPRKLRR